MFCSCFRVLSLFIFGGEGVSAFILSDLVFPFVIRVLHVLFKSIYCRIIS